MAKQPAVVIIARHGARLDAADKSWHLSSPTPYDPPLTYGGWNQSRALGIRIASLVHAREQALNDQVEPPPVEGSAINSRDFAALDSTVEPTADAKQRQSPARGKKRKHKIVIHSSPFQRCTQTSIAISAGIAQYQGSLSSNKKTGEPRPSKTANQMHSASPRLHAVDKQFSPRLEPISEPMPNNSIDALRESLNESRNPVKATLRIDAFLGEWLSPEYFEMITPPPNSTMMVAGAKADLLRRGERIEAFTPTGRNAQGNLWASSGPHASSSGTDGLSNMKSLSHTLPRRDRSNSLGIGPSNSGRSSPFRPSLGSISDASVSSVDTSSGYTAPTPAYAVSPADPIPQGYVAHARDACVDIDYQWDSVREPQLWGDGGEFGEEWSHMHKRFRKGLNKMINWYTEHSTNHGDDHEAVPEAPHDGSDAEEDADTDVVAVLVTHGAGCNALIGALTNQPVLIDVGYAAMTMAVRKDTSPALNAGSTTSPSTSPDLTTRPPLTHHRRSSLDLGLSNQYEMKLVASSEHLRPGVDPARPPPPSISSPLAAVQTIPDSRRRSSRSGRFGSASHAAAGAPIESSWNLGEPRNSIGGSGGRGSVSSALGSIRRSSVQGTHAPARTSSVSAAGGSPVLSPAVGGGGGGGLWQSPVVERGPSPFDSVPEVQSGHSSPLRNSLDLSSSPASALPDPAAGLGIAGSGSNTAAAPAPAPAHVQFVSSKGEGPKETVNESRSHTGLPTVGAQPPAGLGRTLSQKGLWGSAPGGAVSRERGPKRRWTVQQE